MIKYIPYQDIDKDKYDQCIVRSPMSRIYAFSWYLDCVSERWDVLVEEDYRTVMPLPIGKKYGIPYIFTPPWVQQLGIFSETGVTQEKVKEFIGYIPKKFLRIDYQLNASNQLKGKVYRKKMNYLLPLNKSYDQIKNNFNKNRRRILNKDFSSIKIDKKGDIDIFLKNFKTLEKPYEIPDRALGQLRSLHDDPRVNLDIWNAFVDDCFIGGLIWVLDQYRITYLVPVSTSAGKNHNVSTYLIDELIRTYQGSSLTLDFEGSMLSGVEKFYRSFGARTEHYSYIKKRIVFYG